MNIPFCVFGDYEYVLAIYIYIWSEIALALDICCLVQEDILKWFSKVVFAPLPAVNESCACGFDLHFPRRLMKLRNFSYVDWVFRCLFSEVQMKVSCGSFSSFIVSFEYAGFETFF